MLCSHFFLDIFFILIIVEEEGFVMKLLNYFLGTTIFLSGITFFYMNIGSTNFSSNFASPGKAKIAIVAPMQHNAMDAIASGVKEVVKNYSKGNIEVSCYNAHGDLNIQKAIFQQLNSSDVNVIMPIGTSTMQMCLQTFKEKPVVGLAANFNSEDQKKLSSQNATCILDELPLSQHLELMKYIIPNLQKITLIHSPSEKIYPELKNLKILSKKNNIEVQYLLAQQMSDLFTIATAIDFDSQAIFVLKDHLVVSTIAAIVQEAEKRHIPVITSDEGSILAGAAFALGISETDIGKQGARYALSILNGIPANEIPIINQDSLKILANEKRCLHQGVSIESLHKAAKALSFEYVNVRVAGEG